MVFIEEHVEHDRGQKSALHRRSDQRQEPTKANVVMSKGWPGTHGESLGMIGI